jgi:molecular chaperone HtpG
MPDNVGLAILDTLTTALYEDPIVVFREYVQNSLDSTIGTEHKVTVKIEIDRDNKSIVIKDDGPGIISSDFESCMIGIGKSNKPSHSIGFRGIGRLSALSFCEELTFRSKATGENKINIFSWKGAEYSEMLVHDKEGTLDSCIKKITKLDSVETDETKNHFFEVLIRKYDDQIGNIVENKNFKDRLALLLPIDYSNEFKNGAKKIRKAYNEFYGREFDEYVCSVLLDGGLLSKPYVDYNVGKEIYFRELTIQTDNGKEPSGLLWFTFDEKMKKNAIWNKNDISGIAIRSKNIQMGNRKSLAVHVSRSDRNKITLRELMAVMDGLCGELLILPENCLEDDAKREWFKPTEGLRNFTSQLADFLLQAQRYRYDISRYVNSADKNEVLLDRAVESMSNLISRTINEENLKIISEIERKAPKQYIYADKDVPNESITRKEFYDELLGCIDTFMNEKNNMLLFEQMRLYIRSNLKKNGDSDDGEDSAG